MWHFCTIKEFSEAQRETAVSMCVLVHLENNVLPPHRAVTLELASAREKPEAPALALSLIKDGGPQLYRAAKTYSDWNP